MLLVSEILFYLESLDPYIDQNFGLIFYFNWGFSRYCRFRFQYLWDMSFSLSFSFSCFYYFLEIRIRPFETISSIILFKVRRHYLISRVTFILIIYGRNPQLWTLIELINTFLSLITFRKLVQIRQFFVKFLVHLLCHLIDFSILFSLNSSGPLHILIILSTFSWTLKVSL